VTTGLLKRMSLTLSIILALTGCSLSTQSVGTRNESNKYDPAIVLAGYLSRAKFVKLCMKRQGFPFVRNNTPTGAQIKSATVLSSSPKHLILEMTVEEAKKDGLGFTATDSLNALAFPEFPPPDFDGDPTKTSQSEAEFQVALWGSVDQSNAKTGCFEQAINALGGLSRGESLKYVVDQEKLEDLAKRFESDPVVRASGERWAKCVSLAGYRKPSGRPWNKLAVAREVQATDSANPFASLDEESSFAVVYIQCLIPERKTLANSWREIFRGVDDSVL
jgi:hypothetical protein